MFEAMKRLRDVIEVNAPIGGAFAVVTLTDWEAIFRIAALIVGAICTILVTIHKLKQKDEE